MRISRKNKKRISFLIFLFISAIVYFISKDNELLQTDKNFVHQPIQQDSTDQENYEPTVMYGMIVDTLVVIEDHIKPNQNLSQILTPYNISFVMIDKLAKLSREIFDVRKIATNKKYTLFCSGDSAQTAHYLVYEPNEVEYVIFNLQDSLKVSKFQKEVDTVEKSISGSIETSLYNSMLQVGGTAELVDAIADILGWQIDFFRLQKNDEYKIVYNEISVGGKVISQQEIIGAYFKHGNKEYYAIPFEQEGNKDYFDKDGGSLRKAFMRDPLQYTRISSRYSKNRYHPVQKRYKPHLGTDYAAPTGTPIMTVGNGTVVEAKYGRFNGNYVKIKHNNTYTTQYLHMSRIASGIKAGATVSKGQLIGYVGSTGLASGPHLCFRFWKNNKQVDALTVELPKSEPVQPQSMTAFNGIKDVIVQKLDSIIIRSIAPLASAQEKIK